MFFLCHPWFYPCIHRAKSYLWAWGSWFLRRRYWTSCNSWDWLVYASLALLMGCRCRDFMAQRSRLCYFHGSSKSRRRRLAQRITICRFLATAAPSAHYGNNIKSTPSIDGWLLLSSEPSLPSNLKADSWRVDHGKTAWLAWMTMIIAGSFGGISRCCASGVLRARSSAEESKRRFESSPSVMWGFDGLQSHCSGTRGLWG